MTADPVFVAVTSEMALAPLPLALIPSVCDKFRLAASFERSAMAAGGAGRVAPVPTAFNATTAFSRLIVGSDGAHVRQIHDAAGRTMLTDDGK